MKAKIKDGAFTKYKRTTNQTITYDIYPNYKLYTIS